MRILLTTMMLCLFAVSARSDERKLAGAEIETLLSDHEVRGTDDANRIWTQVFHADGRTQYVIDGNRSDGRWQVRGDHYCSQWPPSNGWSCYEISKDGDAVGFISSSGKVTAARVLP